MKKLKIFTKQGAKLITIFLLIALFLVFICIRLLQTYDLTSEVPVIYDDELEKKVVHIMSYEYFDIEDFVPTEFRRVEGKEFVSDLFSCDFFLNNVKTNLDLVHSDNCPTPEYWKKYNFLSANSTVYSSYAIFADEEKALAYYNYTKEVMNDLMLEEFIYGSALQSRTIIVPSKPGSMVDNIQLYLFSFDKQDYEDLDNLLSLILSDRTVYIIYERSSDKISKRKFTTAYNSEFHDNAIRRRNIQIID